jgi:NAD(P)-dependent dehydrogenase (short-subunit alcohol dehydrogenase family)
MTQATDARFGKVAVISGGLGDIGRAIAVDLARRGVAVAIGDVRPPGDAEPLLAELNGLGVRCRYDRADVADSVAVRQWVSAVADDLGPPDRIIPNAAIVTLLGFEQLTAEVWARELRVNLDGAFHLAHAATTLLLARGLPGRVAFIGSWAGHAPHVHIPAYCVAKAGLRMLMKCMAAELAPRGILVNEVAPGYVDAGLSGRIFDQDPAVRQRAVATVPVGRLIAPAEVAHAVAHLCDEDNRHMTGSVLLMDGGLSLVGPAAGNRQ